uniref:Peptidase S1 domain-containing protein n=1 Tax=Anopheles funestus TaxID=62324 RepID=A0A4Y0BK26_ANOFN
MFNFMPHFMAGLVLVLFCNSSLGERIAAKKCNEYRNVIATTHKIIHLLIDPTPIEVKVYNCTNELKLIVGGEQARKGEFPHQALLGYPKENDPYDYEFVCGGTLISEQHVLTAAHCFSERDLTVVRLGEYDTSSRSFDELQLKVDRIRRHPRYPRNQPYDDIAIVRLERPVQLSKDIRPACLWDSVDRTTSKFIASGFGRRDFFDTELSPTLMKVQLDEFPKENCARNFPRLRRGLRPGQLCIGSVKPNKDTCQGDSGGPLQLVTNETTCTYHIVGITSLGGACAFGKSLGIYTEVARYDAFTVSSMAGCKIRSSRLSNTSGRVELRV